MVSTASTQIELSGRKLFWVRVAWLSVLIIGLPLYFVSLPRYVELLHQTCARAECVPFQPPPEVAQALTAAGINPTFYTSYIVIAQMVTHLVYLSVGLWLLARSRRPAVLFIACAFMMYTLFLNFWVDSFRITSEQPVSLLIDLFQSFTIWSMVTGLYIFPDGQFIPRWTRISSIAWGIYTIIVPLFFPFILSGYTWRALSLLISMIWFGSCALAQFQRFRHTTSSVARQQTRWVVYGITISVLGFILSYGSLIALMQIPGAENIVIVAWLVLIPTHMVLFPIFPLSVAFAIFRYRLFDLDLLINRSLVYGLLALILVVLSLCAFFTVQTALGLLTNSEQPPQLALFASVALLALAYNPIYARIRHFVDTRIYDLRADLDELARPRPQPEIKKRGELTGLKIGAYDLLDPLGKGGMGEVYKGWHRERDEIAAVKVLADNLSNDEKVLARFHREADAIRQLQHPHIIGLRDFVRQDGRYFMMLDYLDGQSLDDYLKSNGVLSLEAACRILAQIASALDYVHAQQVIHRDIKPANILLRVDGQEAVLSDFGIAKVGNVTGLTGTDATIGTVSYMSPEQIIASKEVTKNADIYSLGVTLYEMLTGHLPFEQGNIASVIFAHLQKPAPDIRELRPDLPHSVSGAIQQAMEKEPENRFASAGEFAAVICQAASSHDATQR